MGAPRRTSSRESDGSALRLRAFAHRLQCTAAAPLAQSAEHIHGKDEVVSSILTGGSARWVVACAPGLGARVVALPALGRLALAAELVELRPVLVARPRGDGRSAAATLMPTLLLREVGAHRSGLPMIRPIPGTHAQLFARIAHP